MPNYKNQNVITNISVSKIKHNQGENCSWMQPFNWDKMMIPLFLLTGNEYKFYMYLFSWAGKGEYEFSPADLAKKINIKEDTSRKIFKNFIEYGFLVQISQHKYKFDPFPDTIISLYNEKYVNLKLV